MEETKKEILFMVHNLDAMAGRCSNKFKVMNLIHLLQILDHVDEQQLKDIECKLKNVLELFKPLDDFLTPMEEPLMELVKSYDREEYKKKLLGIE